MYYDSMNKTKQFYFSLLSRIEGGGGEGKRFNVHTNRNEERESVNLKYNCILNYVYTNFHLYIHRFDLTFNQMNDNIFSR